MPLEPAQRLEDVCHWGCSHAQGRAEHAGEAEGGRPAGAGFSRVWVLACISLLNMPPEPAQRSRTSVMGASHTIRAGRNTPGRLKVDAQQVRTSQGCGLYSWQQPASQATRVFVVLRHGALHRASLTGQNRTRLAGSRWMIRSCGAVWLREPSCCHESAAHVFAAATIALPGKFIPAGEQLGQGAQGSCQPRQHACSICAAAWRSTLRS